MNALEEAERWGIDLTLIEESLRLTPEQRAIQHQRALEMALQMEAAYHVNDGGSEDGRTQSASAGALRR